MKTVCPHCGTTFFEAPNRIFVGKNADTGRLIRMQTCTSCGRHIVTMVTGTLVVTRINADISSDDPQRESMLYPRVAAGRKPCHPTVPPDLAEDYREACLVLSDSAKASAALSRRCLQQLLRDHAGVTPGDLSREIDQVMPKLPSHLSSAIDAVRSVGNFAAHPQKDTQTGLVLPVEQNEAEWTLDVLEGLFDFYFVAPFETQQKRDAMNAKLAAAGKPALK